jgi:hypothetical protein
MAKKKSSKKAASKQGKKAAKKPAKQPARKPAAKKSGRTPKDIRKVGTGGGASAGDIGHDLVAMFNKGLFSEIEKKYWSPAIVSCVGGGAGLEWVGRKAVARKGSEWHAENRIHGASAEGPFVGSTGFAVRFRMDVEQLASGSRTHFDEVGVYTIRNGKIVREEFMYGGAS